MAKIAVAPFAGAWIEMTILTASGITATSLPSRERGLKFREISKKPMMLMSLPSRERGLKYIRRFYRWQEQRRSLRGSVD